MAEPDKTFSSEDPDERLHSLFKRYSRPLGYFFRNRGVSAEEAQELTQETFFSAAKGMKHLREDSNETTWLFSIAGNLWRNTLRDRHAAKRFAPEVSLDDGPASTEDSFESQTAQPLEDLIAAETHMRLRVAVSELPQTMRSCLLLRIDQDMKYREIASVLQISIDSVKSSLYQAKQRLQKKLGHTAPTDL